MTKLCGKFYGKVQPATELLKKPPAVFRDNDFRAFPDFV
jgi:hypothetical protein